MSKFFRLERSRGGRIHGYLFGIKVFSFKLENVIGKKRAVRVMRAEQVSKAQLRMIHEQYKRIEEGLRDKAARGEKIKVVFMVSLSSMFPARPLFEKLLTDDAFDAKLLIVPDYRFEAGPTIRKTIEDLAEYKEHTLISPVEKEADTIDLKGIADIVFCSLPYDLSHSKYGLWALIDQGILPAAVCYTIHLTPYGRDQLIGSEAYSLYWKVFVETESTLREYSTHQLVKGSNAVFTGYCKMDFLARAYEALPARKERKTIILAPHHSLPGGYNATMHLSNFLKYSQLFLSLPDEYPGIDFIFRPHPALFPCLERKEFWGKEAVREYLDAITGKPNVIYSDRGDYFEAFAQSDGIIQDCGSYLAEYLFTKKPCCYLLKSPADITEQFIELGQLCLHNCYLAYDEEAIRHFIDSVIVAGDDPMKQAREKFAEEVLMVNYPHAADKIADYLRESFNVR